MVGRSEMNSKHPPSFPIQELEHFQICQLKNHWSRATGARAYYWYLTFEDSPELHPLARQCQDAIAFPYYDLMPLADLHLTLDRIAFEGNITSQQLDSIEAYAINTCRSISPLDITIEDLGGTHSAVGLNASPAQRIRDLRDKLRAATLSAYPNAPISSAEFRPHITIAYANSDNIPAAEILGVVEKLNSTISGMGATVRYGTLVLLERRQRSYAWEALSRIPLRG
jgi:2'-5' RNA ligase